MGPMTLDTFFRAITWLGPVHLSDQQAMPAALSIRRLVAALTTIPGVRERYVGLQTRSEVETNDQLQRSLYDVTLSKHLSSNVELRHRHHCLWTACTA